MKLIGLVLFGIAVMAQQPDPSQPFPNHEEPPPGWFCTADARQADHKCACRNMPKEPNDPVCHSETQEDATCKVFCHADHCRCQMKCES